MAVYVTDLFSNMKLGDNSKPWTLTADTIEELEEMAEKLNLNKDRFSSDTSVPFYVISRSKSKIAVNLGALKGEEAAERINLIRNLIGKGILDENAKPRND